MRSPGAELRPMRRLLGSDPNDDLEPRQEAISRQQLRPGREIFPPRRRDSIRATPKPGSGWPRPMTVCAASISPTAPTLRPSASSGRPPRFSITRVIPTCCAATTSARARSWPTAQRQDPSNKFVLNNIQLLEDSCPQGQGHRVGLVFAFPNSAATAGTNSRHRWFLMQARNFAACRPGGSARAPSRLRCAVGNKTGDSTSGQQGEIQWLAQ